MQIPRNSDFLIINISFIFVFVVVRTLVGKSMYCKRMIVGVCTIAIDQ